MTQSLVANISRSVLEPFPIQLFYSERKQNFIYFIFIYLKNCIYLFLGRGERRKRNIDVKEKHQLVALIHALTRDGTHNPGMCPDPGLNQTPFALWTCTQPTESHQSGLFSLFFNCLYSNSKFSLFGLCGILVYLKGWPYTAMDDTNCQLAQQKSVS